MNRRSFGIAVGAVAWISCVGTGFVTLWSYAATPGDAGATAPSWPAASELRRRTDGPTLVMVAHTECPCTQASMAELREIVGRARDAVHVIVLLEPAPGSGEDPLESGVARMARDLPGVEVVVDRDHHEADLLGARTSGHTVLFDAEGTVLFAGGITGSRGHAGENEGRASVLALIQRRPGSAATPTFGCPTLAER